MNTTFLAITVFQTLLPFWTNALHWLDQGRDGVVGVLHDNVLNNLVGAGLKCERTNFRADLSVYVCTAYNDANAKEIQDFVAQGGGLLIGGHAWYWAQTHSGQSPMTEFAGIIIQHKITCCQVPHIIIK